MEKKRQTTKKQNKPNPTQPNQRKNLTAVSASRIQGNWISFITDKNVIWDNQRGKNVAFYLPFASQNSTILTCENFYMESRNVWSHKNLCMNY